MPHGVVAIVTDDPGWHGRELTSALASHGFHGIYVSLTDCLLQIGHAKEEVVLKGFNQPPTAVFIRGVPGGSLEQVIFRLNILHALQQDGIVIMNQPRAIERTVDKPLTSLMLSRAGLPTPRTWICESLEQANAILQQQTSNGSKLVQKPLFGSQGIGLHLVDTNTGLMHDEKFAGVYYLQEFIHRPNQECFDIRVLVVDGKAIAAMKRCSSHWLTNRAQGASCEPFKLDREVAGIAEKAVSVLDIDYAGVDLIPDQNGCMHVIEVNSIPAWYGLQQVCSFNIANILIDTLINKIALDYRLDEIS